MKSKVTVTYDIEFEIEFEHEPDDDEIEDKVCAMIEGRFGNLNFTVHDVMVDIENA